MARDSTSLQELQSILQHSTAGSKEFSDALALANVLVDTGNIEAGLFLSWLYTQRGEIKDATKKAYDLCEKISNTTGHPVALERMADLLLWGVGIEKDEKKSFQIYQHLAQQGMLPLTTLSYLYSQGIGIQPDECEATNLLLKSAAQGDTLAFVLLSYRYEIGLGAPVNGTIARAFAILADKRNFPGSNQRLKMLNIRFASTDDFVVQELVLKIINSIETLYEKIDRLAQEMPPQSAEFVDKYMALLAIGFAELGLKDLSIDHNARGFVIRQKAALTLQPKIIRDKPLIMVVDDFASFEECQHIINQAIPMLESTASQLQKRSNAEVDAFSGESAIFARKQTSPIDRVIQNRHAKIENIPIAHFEPMSLLKYSVGHDYSVHTDAFDEARIVEHEEKGDFGGQRMTVNLIYLLPALKGGETHYENIDLKITGKVGTGIIHHNATDDFKIDLKSRHTGLAIIEGEKWLLRTATRQSPLYGINKTAV